MLDDREADAHRNERECLLRLGNAGVEHQPLRRLRQRLTNCPKGRFASGEMRSAPNTITSTTTQAPDRKRE
ncbi:hypothetical protein San01_60990 [Streptomyces angustmyceticus]|uniref:Uncharacterized protein n=1 Tax=Streptomyces angustmyceticus TaxID=285578 RepID=A0A5J4LNM3_9ACTN|nr:hypothetical protein San01_60990 [Streptomyces angustmyceticus]